MSFCLDRCDLRQATSSLLRGHLCIPTRSNTPIRWWIEAQVQPNVQHEGRASFGHDCRPHQQRAPGGGLRLHGIQSCRLMRRRSVGDGTTGRRSDDLTWANECSPDDRQVTKFRGFSAVALARKPQIGTFTHNHVCEPASAVERGMQVPARDTGCQAFRKSVNVPRAWLCPAQCPSDGDHFLKWCLQTFTLPATAYRRPSTSL
jgi:hypothetical protein